MSPDGGKSAKAAALKAARERIEKKDFKAALSSCKKALNVDKNNYLALVMSGLCLTELKHPDQAIAAYRRAVDLNSEQLQAWQGLSRLYEGMKPEKNSDLSRVYAEMLAIHEKAGDVGKYLAASRNLADLFATGLDNIDDCVATIETRIDVLRRLNATDDQLQGIVSQSYGEMIRTVNHFAARIPLTVQQNEMLLEVIEKVLNDSGSIQNMDNFRTYLRLLYKMRKMAKLAEGALAMSDAFPGSPVALEWLCKVYMEWAADGLDNDPRFDRAFENVDVRIRQLLEHSPSSTLGRLASAVATYKAAEAEARETGGGPRLDRCREAKRRLEELLFEHKSNHFHACYVLCQCALAVGDEAGLERCINQAELLLDDKVKEEGTRRAMARRLRAMKVRCLYRQSKFVKALELLDDEREEEPPASSVGAKVLAMCGQRQRVEALLPDFGTEEQLLLKAMLTRAEGDSAGSLEVLGKLEEKGFEPLLLEGQCLWDIGRFDESLQRFLLAAKANPSSWVPFNFLGKHYRRKGDLDKAKRCFLKSLGLNPTSSEAGSELSDVYRALGHWEENLQFLTAVTSLSDGKAAWADLRLGMHHLAVGEFNLAIASLQSVLQSDPGNGHALESLADAYGARGSFKAALKAYNKVLGMRPDTNLYARLQVATIRYKLGYYEDAIKELEDILSVEEGYVPALKVLGESLVSQARKFLADYLDSNAVDNCKKAILRLANVVDKSRSDLFCLWKLLADCCLLLHEVSPSVARFDVPRQWRTPTLEISEREPSALTKTDILELGAKACIRALQIQTSNPTAWHDLAFAYHVQVREIKGLNPSGDTQPLEDKCLTAVKKAISLDSRNHHHWNALGVFCMSLTKPDWALAQHALVKSIGVESTAAAWTNLGILYLTLGEKELSEKAFKEAQCKDPLYTRGWVGQALAKESMDLFRHATSLGNDPECSLGYANWVCRTVSTGGHGSYCVEKMHGVAVATDCLQRHVQRFEGDCCALNMFGVLLDRENRLRSSRAALEEALDHTKADELKSAAVGQNLARVLLKLGEFQEAKRRYLEVTHRDFHGQVGYAFSCTKVGTLEEAYEAYRQAFEMAESNVRRAQVLTAMATIAFEVHGADAAKTLLFKASQLRPTSINGLLALCVLGMKRNDPALIGAALQEVNRHQGEDLEAHLADVSSLRALVLTLKGDLGAARNVLASATHRHPHLSSLWGVLSLHLLRHHDDPKLACKCAGKASALSRVERTSRNHGASVMRPAEATHLPAMVALCLVTAGDESGVKAASKAVHEHPHSSQTWSVLASAVGPGQIQLYSRLLQTAKGVDEPPSTVSSWIVNQL